MTVGLTVYLPNRSPLSSTRPFLNIRSRIFRTTMRFTNSITSFPLPPRGGDVFWSAPGAAQGAGGVYRPISSKFAYQKGISIGSRLAVIYNRKDYMCSMETAEVDSRARLRDRRSPDVHRFMTNLFVYAMKYGGNTDRSDYKR